MNSTNPQPLTFLCKIVFINHIQTLQMPQTDTNLKSNERKNRLRIAVFQGHLKLCKLKR